MSKPCYYSCKFPTPEWQYLGGSCSVYIFDNITERDRRYIRMISPLDSNDPIFPLSQLVSTFFNNITKEIGEYVDGQEYFDSPIHGRMEIKYKYIQVNGRCVSI
jgi:hypothetical protein